MNIRAVSWKKSWIQIKLVWTNLKRAWLKQTLNPKLEYESLIFSNSNFRNIQLANLIKFKKFYTKTMLFHPIPSKQHRFNRKNIVLIIFCSTTILNQVWPTLRGACQAQAKFGSNPTLLESHKCLTNPFKWCICFHRPKTWDLLTFSETLTFFLKHTSLGNDLTFVSGLSRTAMTIIEYFKWKLDRKRDVKQEILKFLTMVLDYAITINLSILEKGTNGLPLIKDILNYTPSDKISK